MFKIALLGLTSLLSISRVVDLRSVNMTANSYGTFSLTSLESDTYNLVVDDDSKDFSSFSMNFNNMYNQLNNGVFTDIQGRTINNNRNNPFYAYSKSFNTVNGRVTDNLFSVTTLNSYVADAFLVQVIYSSTGFSISTSSSFSSLGVYYTFTCINIDDENVSYSYHSVINNTDDSYHSFVVDTDNITDTNSDTWTFSIVLVNFSAVPSANYQSGYQDGYEQGNSDGYDYGYAVGKETGFNLGIDTSNDLVTLLFTVADTPIYYLKSLFNVQIFGFNVAVVVLGLVTSLVIIWVVKRFI